MTDTPQPAQRPVLLSLTCIFGTIGALIAASQAASHWQDMIDESTHGAIATILGLVVTLLCLFGLWRMKRWGVVVFSVALAARVAYGLAGGPPLSIGRLAGPALILLVGSIYFRRLE